MTILQIQFDETRLQVQGTLFPDEIADDLWVAFHGTSDFTASAIERTGLSWERPLVGKEDVQRISDIYQTMGWEGLDPGGFIVLRSYSLDHDFSQSEESPIYFAEADFRALTFAQRDFAGGEKARAVRRALRDLGQYLSDSEFRAKQLARGSRAIDLQWLRDQLEELRDLRLSCESVFERFRHGVIYAVRFEPSDLAEVEFHNTMGIKVRSRIDATRILARVDIPDGVGMDPFNRPGRERVDRARIATDGLVPTLRSKRT